MVFLEAERGKAEGTVVGTIQSIWEQRGGSSLAGWVHSRRLRGGSDVEAGLAGQTAKAGSAGEGGQSREGDGEGFPSDGASAVFLGCYVLSHLIPKHLIKACAIVST